MIAAATAYDDNLAVLCDILAKWQIVDANGDGFTGGEGGEGGEGAGQADAIVRAAMIRDMYFTGGLLGGAGFTVDDGAKDELQGGSGSDWFIADGDEDKIKDDNEDIFGLDADWFNQD